MTEKVRKSSPAPELIARLRFLIVDVDGVMTDGSIIYTSEGEEAKTFHVRDGTGLKYWARAGHRTGIITGRASQIVSMRAKELGIEFVQMNAKFKLPALEKMIAAAGVTLEETVMIGDDLPDLPLIRRVGFGVAVADAVDEVKDAAAMVTEKKGGFGAVRELVEFVLKSQGRWDGIMERYLQ